MKLTAEEFARLNKRATKNRKGCIVFGGTTDRTGYGEFFYKGRIRRAHRVAWFNLNGPIPKGMFIDHTCGVRDCINPQHLRLVTPKQNALDNSRSMAAVNAKKTRCPKGHVYDTRDGEGTRRCSACRREAKRMNYRKRRTLPDTVSC